MAKVLITYFQIIIDKNPSNLICYYEGLIKELNRFGNDVMYINMSGLNLNRTIIDEVKKFNPDVIFTFNNRISEEFIKVTNCPILLFDADSLDLFDNINLIKKYNDRYYMLTSYEGWDNRYSQIGFTKEQICTIHPATAIKNEHLEKDKNISFIGSIFNLKNYKLSQYIRKDNDRGLYKAIIDFLQNDDYDYDKILKKYCPDNNFNKFDIHCMFDNRAYVLSSILDLGLNLYGKGWERLSSANYALASAYINKLVYTLEQNQEIYNSSKINISISHPQTNGYAFPWRIYDIMASDGLLISSRADLLTKLTKGIVDIPMFNSPFEARELCKKYLKEENMRKDIIAASNEYIEKFGRWKNNFEIIQDLTSIKLVTNDNKIGSHYTPNTINKYKPYKNDKRRKNISNGIFLILSNLPMIEKIFNEKMKNKLYDSIDKNKIL